MSFDEQFYINLPSSSSLDLFPDNKLASFKVKLSRCLDFESLYEVALSEIIINSKAKNLDLDSRQIKITRYLPHFQYKIFSECNIKDYYLKPDKKDTEKPEIYPVKIITTSIILPQRIYTDAYDLIEQVNTELRQTNFCQDLRIIPDAFGIIVSSEKYNINDKNYKLAIKGKILNSIYNLEKVKKIKHSKRFFTRVNPLTNFKPPDIAFIYTNIVDFSHVGSRDLQLLRILNIHIDKNFNFCSVRFDKPHYIPLIKSSFDTINIDIKTIEGDLFPFGNGSLIVKLHLRKRKY